MNRFIMADSEKCIGCRTCEVACAVSHQEFVIANNFMPRIRVVKGFLYHRGRVSSVRGCALCKCVPNRGNPTLSRSLAR